LTDAATPSNADTPLRAPLPSAAATLVVALPLSWLLWLSGAVPLYLAAAAMVLFVLIVQSAGTLLLRAAHASDMGALAAWVLGIFATAMAVYALAASFELLASTAFAIWAAVVVALGVVFHRRAAAARPVPADELVALLVCGAATVLWCLGVGTMMGNVLDNPWWLLPTAVWVVFGWVLGGWAQRKGYAPAKGSAR